MNSSPLKPAPILLNDYKAPEYLIETVDLTVDLFENETIVTSKMALKRQADQPVALILNGENLELRSLKLNGATLPAVQYKQTKRCLIIEQDETAFDLEIVTVIKPQENTELEGLYKSSGNFCTQCEAEGFRKITYYLDRPDVMARFTTTITGDATSYPVMLSNGNLTDSGRLESGRHWVKWEDPFPKPAYLFALVAGNLACVEDQFTTSSGRRIQLKIYVEHGNEHKCSHAMESLKKSMKWDEDLYGREYDLDIFMIVAVGDFNMGAMENKGLNIFNSKYVLASPDTATDSDYDGIESVIAHEYFHNWTGNRITCRDWFQLTLKEGLTVFRDQQFSAAMNSAAVKRIEDVQRLRASQFPEDAGPLSHPIQPKSYVEINNFYTATIYEKGAEVIRMIHTLLGPEKFRNAMDLYFDRHDGEAVTTADFLKAMEDGSGVNLQQFNQWYNQGGTPEILVQESYDDESKLFNLTLTQKNPKTSSSAPLHIPIRIGLLAADGSDIKLELSSNQQEKLSGDVLQLCKRAEIFQFRNVRERPTLSLLRGFSAPVKIKQSQSLKQLSFLLTHDQDPFNRWEAAQRLATTVTLKLIKDYRDKTELALPSAYLEAFKAILADTSLEQSFSASLLTLPSEAYIGQQMPLIDVDAIHHVRDFVRNSIGTYFEKPLRRIYDENIVSHDGNNSTISGRRKLKNLALSYLSATESDIYTHLSFQQFSTSDNMTDVVAALSLLCQTDDKLRDQALSNFYEKWQDDALVIDKWFSLQAMSKRPNALKDVKALLEHPAFTLLNPNRVRSLIASFAAGNAVHFHKDSGEGYQFLGDQIEKLNKINPQIAARLVSPLGQWRRYDDHRQTLMKQELNRLNKIENLSNHVFEMVSKSL